MCLNPCCSGSGILTPASDPTNDGDAGLNPCCSGSGILTNPINFDGFSIERS